MIFTELFAPSPGQGPLPVLPFLWSPGVSASPPGISSFLSNLLPLGLSVGTGPVPSVPARPSSHLQPPLAKAPSAVLVPSASPWPSSLQTGPLPLAGVWAPGRRCPAFLSCREGASVSTPFCCQLVLWNAGGFPSWRWEGVHASSRFQRWGGPEGGLCVAARCGDTARHTERVPPPASERSPGPAPAGGAWTVGWVPGVEGVAVQTRGLAMKSVSPSNTVPDLDRGDKLTAGWALRWYR